MLRIWVAVIVIALFPFVAPAEEQAAEQHIESQAGKEEQVIVTVSIEKQSGEVRISILKVNKEKKEQQQKGELVLSDNKEPTFHKKHSRRRGK
jgi:hypothetical protein